MMCPKSSRDSSLPSADDRDWINPYRRVSEQFPGRIFSLDREEPLLREFLARPRPQIVELGSGSGRHLLELGRRYPAADCWGFEVRYKRAVRTIEKAKVEKIENVYVLRGDGRRISEFFAPASISAIYVNFPDPWEKRKRQKHRLLNDRLLTAASTLLTESGFLSIKTDHEDYYSDFCRFAAEHPDLVISEQSRDLHRSELCNENIVTEFESLFLRQQLPIFYMKLSRR
jgi:tRNA (guanine-N7-)-methyltransferase